jgi:hypothetical protein
MIRHIRWTPLRKSEAIEEIKSGKMNRTAFMTANNISEDEMREWERDAEKGPKAHSRKARYQRARREGLL